MASFSLCLEHSYQSSPPLSVGFAAETPNHILGATLTTLSARNPTTLILMCSCLVFLPWLFFPLAVPPLYRLAYHLIVTSITDLHDWLAPLLAKSISTFCHFPSLFLKHGSPKNPRRCRQSRTGLSLPASHYLESIQKPLQPAANSHAVQTEKKLLIFAGLWKQYAEAIFMKPQPCVYFLLF